MKTGDSTEFQELNRRRTQMGRSKKDSYGKADGKEVEGCAVQGAGAWIETKLALKLFHRANRAADLAVNNSWLQDGKQ